MSILIVGNSQVNEALKEGLLDYDVHILPGIDDIIRVRGHIGAFMVQSAERVIPAEGIIIAQAPAIEVAQIGEGKPLNLAQTDLADRLEELGRGEKIIFLLDYFSETAEYFTESALEHALYWLRQGRQVVFLSRFVKTAPAGMEQLYRDARLEGLSFIKYEKLNCDYESGIFIIEAFDGLFTTTFQSPALVVAGKELPETQKAIIKKLRLTKLAQPLSSRRGIFYINPRQKQALKTALPLILAELHAIAKTYSLTEGGRDCVGGVSTDRQGIMFSQSRMRSVNKLAERISIDADKCAFCYSCYRICPHAALAPDTDNNAMMRMEAACLACGACAAICPGQAISFEREDIRPPSVKEYVFACENSAYIALNQGLTNDDLSEDLIEGLSKDLTIEKIPCGGRLGQDVLAAALHDYERIVVAVCVDDACKHSQGGRRGCQHAEKIAAEAKKLGLDKKISFVKASYLMENVVMENVVMENVMKENVLKGELS